MTTSNTPDQRIDDIRISVEFGTLPKLGETREFPLTSTAKAALRAIVEEMYGDIIGEDEPVPASIFDYGDDDQRKWWYNRLKTEQRQRIPQVLDKYFGASK